MKSELKRWAWIAFGWLFVVLGILGLFLPFLQGILFLLIGLLILSSEYVWAHHLVRKLRAKFPLVDAQLQRTYDRFRARWGADPANKA